MTFFTNEVSGCPPPSLLTPSTFTLDKLKQEVGWQGFSGLLNTQSAIATLAYYALSMVLYKIIPTTEINGTKLRSGGKLVYRLNSMSNRELVCRAITDTMSRLPLCAIHHDHSGCWYLSTGP